MRLRPATPQDAAALDTLWIEVWRAAYSDRAEPEVLAALTPHGQAEWQRRMQRAGSVTLAEGPHGELLGYCWRATPARDDDLPRATAEIAELNVAPAAWRRGVGRALLEDAIDALQQDARFADVVVWTLDDNQRSLPLYESLGFRRDGATRTDPGWWVADVRLARSLGRA